MHCYKGDSGILVGLGSTGIKLYILKELGYPLCPGREFRGGIHKLVKVIHLESAFFPVLVPVVFLKARTFKYLIDKAGKVLIRLGKESCQPVIDLKELLKTCLALPLGACHISSQPGSYILSLSS